ASAWPRCRAAGAVCGLRDPAPSIALSTLLRISCNLTFIPYTDDMKIDVTPQTLAVIHHFMATGRYQSEADALHAALDERIDPYTGITIKALKAELQRGLDQIERGECLPHEEVWATIMQPFADNRE